MAIWHLGEGRHKEKLRAIALPRGGGDWIPGVLDSSFSLLWLTPPSPAPRIHEKSVQDQAQPLAQGWALSLLGWEAGVGDVEATPPSRRPECNRQHNDREEERAKKVESQVKRPRGHMGPVAGSSLQVVRRWESPSSTPVQRHRLEVVKSGSLVCRSLCPSTTQVSSQLLLASVP